MDNIIYYLEAHALGDEIHMHRNILLSLLENNFITNDIVIYCLSDRSFLYTNIFKNVFCYEEVGNLDEIKAMCDAKFNKDFIVIKNFDVCFSIWEIWRNNGGFQNTLNKNISITKPNIFGYEKINYFNKLNYSSAFIDLVTNINYLDTIPKFGNDKFIVYHHRFKNDNTWDGDDQILDAILKCTDEYNIVIFSRKDLKINNQKIHTTTNLQEFATYINNQNCLAVISVWSGGGQFASYCSNSKLLMYFHPSQLQYNLSDEQLNNYIESENAFDFAQFTNIERKFIRDQDIINNIKLFI
jgi:hypothetical protein